MALGIGKIIILIGALMIGGELAIPGIFIGALGMALVVTGIVIELGINDFFLIAAAFAISSAISIYLFSHLNKKLKGIKKQVGKECLEGKRGKVIKSFEKGKGIVKIEGEDWSASSDKDLKEDDEIVVEDVHGVTLKVEKI